MYKVILSRDRKKAVIHYSNGKTLILRDDQQNVVKLVLEVLRPLQTERGE